MLQHNRREIGHGLMVQFSFDSLRPTIFLAGNLAERALLHVVPDEFLFTIRLSAQVLESNGTMW